MQTSPTSFLLNTNEKIWMRKYGENVGKNQTYNRSSEIRSWNASFSMVWISLSVSCLQYGENLTNEKMIELFYRIFIFKNDNNWKSSQSNYRNKLAQKKNNNFSIYSRSVLFGWCENAGKIITMLMVEFFISHRWIIRPITIKSFKWAAFFFFQLSKYKHLIKSFPVNVAAFNAVWYIVFCDNCNALLFAYIQMHSFSLSLSLSLRKKRKAKVTSKWWHFSIFLVFYAQFITAHLPAKHANTK